MPREDRRLIFDYEEVYKAIYALCSKRKMRKPPAGTLSSVAPDDDDDEQVVVLIENQHENLSKTLEYSRDFLAAALMLYCLGEGIPLPKSGTKSVLINEKKVILRVLL
jgi:hypothetical protein